VNRNDTVTPAVLANPEIGPSPDGVPRRSWSRRQGESILHSVVEAAKAFLTASDAERTIPSVLGSLGRATEVSRVYVCQNHRMPDGRLLVDQRYEWAAAGMEPQIGNPAVRDAPLYDLGLERWERLLSKGEVVEGVVSHLSGRERTLLESQGVRSLLVVPIRVEGIWWGFMGFDDCESEREWAPPVLAGLRAAADLFGAMVTRRDLEQRLERLAEATTEGIVVHDGVRILEVNGRVAELLGDPLDAVIGRSPFEFIAPEFRETARENARQDWPEAYEVRILRSDGTSFPAEVQGRSLRLRGEDVRVVVLRDLTVRKAAEESERKLLLERAARVAAERAERRSTFLAEATRLLVASMDTSTSLSRVARLSLQHLGQHCQFRLLVDGVLRTVASAGDIGADPHSGSLPGATESDRSVPELLDRVLAGETVVLDDLAPERCRAVLGWPESAAEFPPGTAFSCLLVPILARDRTLGVMGVGSIDGRECDEEERGTAQEVARRCGFAVEHIQLFDEAQAAVRTRDEVLAVVTHDLRNPLSVIVGGASTLLELEPTAVQRRLAELIGSNAVRMDRMVGDLLEASRIAHGRLSLDLRGHPPALIVREAAEMMRPLAEGQGVQLDASVPEALPLVRADSGRVVQVLSNLVGNAIKFTGPGGRVRIDCVTMEAEVCFQVTDNGPGIRADQIPHLFGAFWQADSSDRRGLGLGLSIARGIVEGHGGRIWLESQVGVGSTFYFTLPIDPLAVIEPATSADRTHG